jgi:hypothetical protein
MVFSLTLKYLYLFKVAFWDCPPEIMGKVPDQQLIYEINRPEDIVDEQQDPAVIVVPADHKRVETKEGIDDAGGSVVHEW